MTVFRLATATVLLAGLALPAFAQGTATPAVTAPPATMTPHATMAPTASRAVPAAPAAASPATPSPVALPKQAESVVPEAREGHAERMRAERAARSHRRLVAEARMERARAPHGQIGEVAPDATR